MRKKRGRGRREKERQRKKQGERGGRGRDVSEGHEQRRPLEQGRLVHKGNWGDALPRKNKFIKNCDMYVCMYVCAMYMHNTLVSLVNYDMYI